MQSWVSVDGIKGVQPKEKTSESCRKLRACSRYKVQVMNIIKNDLLMAAKRSNEPRCGRETGRVIYIRRCVSLNMRLLGNLGTWLVRGRSRDTLTVTPELSGA